MPGYDVGFEDDRRGIRAMDEFERLVLELIEIGREPERRGYSSSGYLRPRETAEASRHPRAREIAEVLFNMGGLGLMQKANRRVSDVLGPVAAMELSHAWHQIAGWLA